MPFDKNDPSLQRNSYRPDVHAITAALSTAAHLIEQAQADAERAIAAIGQPAPGSKEAELLRANEHARTEARRQLAAYEAALKAVAANCCSNQQDCPIDVVWPSR